MLTSCADKLTDEENQDLKFQIIHLDFKPNAEIYELSARQVRSNTSKKFRSEIREFHISPN
ncbi:hypothetical protein BpHYR1_037489 [Brachionus plicatilis]|uniref:Uncharacterized protein n=1 Tax=Brachionus plicatilis TaxID=10195 RepID=A0A3M7Q641_BRAPC|nr:hypothetical protein BpHYR1_037489 [Brachionus plicatilis]